MENKKVAVIGGPRSGRKYAAAISLAMIMAKSELSENERNRITKEAMDAGLPIMKALEDVENLRLSCLAGGIPFESGLSAMEQAISETAEQVPFVQTEPLPITNPYRFEPTEQVRMLYQGAIFGGAYNCRKPKYKTKKRR
jgi:alkyl hydroperoxide reductase subunit AhpF